MDYLNNSVAIHQPNYLPWLGYFYKIYLVNHFIFHDNVDLNQRSYTKRTLVRKERMKEDTQWLIIPIEKSNNKKITAAKITDGNKAIGKHLRKLKYIYKESEFFQECFPFIENLLWVTVKERNKLADFNINCLESISHELGLNTKFSRSSEYNLEGYKSNLNMQLIKTVSGSIYISGTGAKKYQEEKLFQENNINLIYSNVNEYLKSNPYAQGHEPSLMGLSIIDAWMNLGKVGILKLFEKMLNNLKEKSSQ